MSTDPAFCGNRFVSALSGFPCAQRVLMVADGGLDFGCDGFGLSEFVEIVRDAGHAVHTAHRQGQAPGLTITGDFDFSTAVPGVTTEHYDQLWLFGMDGGDVALSDDEQNVIARFMQSGGGVFATGDHADLGKTMGGYLPRVRRMREWHSIPMSGTTRLDTIVNAGSDGIQQFHDQSDAIAQRIFPVFFSNGGPECAQSTWSVHPVLRHPSGAVDFLPDHAHESKCLAPVPTEGDHAGVEEWPVALDGGSRIAPELVAKSISAGRFLADISQPKPPVEPRCFGAISVYDGDRAGVGRIVCDATWHHFINTNLNGAGAVPDTNGTPRIGLYSSVGVPTPEYLKIQTYFRNTVRWLAPRSRRHRWPLLQAAVARFDMVALELRLPRPSPCPWGTLVEIGREMEGVMDRRFGPGALTTAVDDILIALGDGSGLAELLHSHNARARKAGGETLLPLADMRRVVFASLVNVLADRLPLDEREIECRMKRDERWVVDAIAGALSAAEEAIVEHLSLALQRTSESCDLLSTQTLKASLPAARRRLEA